MRKVFGVIGLGRFGFHVARTLAEGGAEVIAVDKNEEKVRQVSEFVTRAYIADALDEKALEEAGMFNADTVVISIGENVEASILVAVLLIGRGVRDIVAKAVNPLHGEVLRRVGVPRVVYPEREMAVRLARSLLITGIIEEVPLAPGLNLYEIEAPPKITGKTLRDLDLRNRYGINVIAIKRKGRVIPNPSADDRIERGDVILLLGSDEALHRLTS
jgi:trk system potassium uptake protein TrkA